jgi:hypothetical protein
MFIDHRGQSLADRFILGEAGDRSRKKYLPGRKSGASAVHRPKRDRSKVRHGG